ncbi:phage major capsid protein [Brachybacterium alimentarium]|uniref:phage major capsid protein n=1 Tax=Brachybacterium alimentarium TaxID=47845 RepID=UPI003FD05D49
MSMNTSNLSAISPDQIEQLVVQPVEANSVALQAGTLVTTAATRTKIPRVTQDPSASWVAEGEEIGTSDPAVDDITVTPEKLAGLAVVSTEAAEDTSPAAADMIGDGLARDIAKKLDAAFFGSAPGGTAQPNGLEDLDDVTEVDAGDAWEDLDPFAAALSNAEGHGMQVSSFVANPADALALSQLKESTSSIRPLLGSDATSATRRVVLGVPLLVSSAVTAGTVWGIPKERAVIVRRKDVELDVDTSAYFTSYRTAVRAIMRVGFGFTDPATIQKVVLSET